VCQAIEKHIPQDVAILLDPLINLVKIGNFMVKSWAFKTLAVLAEKGYEKVLYDQGCVGVAILNLYTSRNADLLEGCLDLLIAVCKSEYIANPPYNILLQPDLTVRLIHLLAPFEKIKVASAVPAAGGEAGAGAGAGAGAAATAGSVDKAKKIDQQRSEDRYHPRVLSRVSVLIVKLCSDKSVLKLMLENHTHSHLCRIVDQHELYHPILVKITNALGVLYVNAGVRMTDPNFSQKEKVLADALSLTKALKNHTTREKLQLCLNILIVLKNMLDWSIVKQKPGENPQVRKAKLEDRVDVLRIISESGFSEAVLRCKTAATKAEKGVVEEVKIYKNEPGYERIEEQERQNRLKELYTWGKIATGVLNKVKWFMSKQEICIAAKWKVSELLEQGHIDK
jgi:hypothetical protein